MIDTSPLKFAVREDPQLVRKTQTTDI
jgi:hypothetical protein